MNQCDGLTRDAHVSEIEIAFRAGSQPRTLLIVPRCRANPLSPRHKSWCYLPPAEFVFTRRGPRFPPQSLPARCQACHEDGLQEKYHYTTGIQRCQRPIEIKHDGTQHNRATAGQQHIHSHSCAQRAFTYSNTASRPNLAMRGRRFSTNPFTARHSSTGGRGPQNAFFSKILT